MVMEIATEARDLSSTIKEWVEGAATGLELLAIAIIVAVILLATIVSLSRIFSREANFDTYRITATVSRARCCWGWKFWLPLT